MNKTEQKTIQEKATFELELLTQDEEYARKYAVQQLQRIVNDAKQLGEMITNPKFDKNNLRDDTLIWINQAVQEYKKEMVKAELLKRTRQSLKYTTEIINGEN